MTSIERTAYPRFTRAPSLKELREIYTPMPTDVAFVATTARGPAQKFGLMILLKVYQRLGYFPKPETIPGAVISHIRAVMKLEADLVPDIASNHTLFAYGTHLGPHQMARHLQGALNADQIAHINRRHFTAEKLEAAWRDVTDRFHRFTLPHYWGDEKRVAADGTHYE